MFYISFLFGFEFLFFSCYQAIAKGCHAAVYAARWTKERAREISSGFERIEGLQEVCERPEEDDGESSERDVQAGNEEAAENDMAESVVRETLAKVTLEIDAEEIGIADGAPDSAVEGKKEAFESKQDDEVFPFAIKMMFNYEAESNSMAILNVMHR